MREEGLSSEFLNINHPVSPGVWLLGGVGDLLDQDAADLLPVVEELPGKVLTPTAMGVAAPVDDNVWPITEHSLVHGLPLSKEPVAHGSWTGAVRRRTVDQGGDTSSRSSSTYHQAGPGTLRWT